MASPEKWVEVKKACHHHQMGVLEVGTILRLEEAMITAANAAQAQTFGDVLLLTENMEGPGSLRRPPPP